MKFLVTLRVIPLLLTVLLAPSCAPAKTNEGSTLEAELLAQGYSEREIDEAFEVGDRTGDYGIIDAVADELEMDPETGRSL